MHAVKKLGVTNTGMEELIAITETNNCFSDGIQMVPGCSFGSNALMFRDLGKTAVTVSRRDGKAIRLVLNPAFEDAREEAYPRVHVLFDRVVARRESGSPEEFVEMIQLFAEMATNELKTPVEEMFKIQEMNITLPEYAPILEQVKCSLCGENVIRSRVVQVDGQPLCLSCAREGCFEMNGGVGQKRVRLQFFYATLGRLSWSRWTVRLKNGDVTTNPGLNGEVSLPAPFQSLSLTKYLM